jgi:A/G-specific adenine glycosylase
VRGLILAALRASHVPVTATAVEALWHEPVQRDRALMGLVTDGLAVETTGGYTLP